MAYNYLPFARRVYLTLPPLGAVVDTRLSIPRESFSSGMGRRAFLSDLAVDIFPLDSKNNSYDYDFERTRNERLFMRMGVFGRPYMTEDMYPIALFNDTTPDEVGVWRLPKPYTIFPGERLKARVIYSPGGAVIPLPEDAFSGVYATWPSISFHGVRRDNNRSVILFDTYHASFDAHDVFTDPPLGTPVILQGERLQCPKETPVDIYAVKESMGFPMGGITDNQFPATQIYSPDGRKWWENDNWPQILQPTFVMKNLRGPEWVLEPEETVQVEFENLASWPVGGELTYIMVMVTLRGQIEVEI